MKIAIPCSSSFISISVNQMLAISKYTDILQTVTYIRGVMRNAAYCDTGMLAKQELGDIKIFHTQANSTGPAISV